jgi:type II secretory pathway pseudopilin PulG
MKSGSPLQRRRGYTLIETFVTIGLLIIVLGLMVSLARYVRNRSAKELTKAELRRLANLMDDYMQSNGGRPPVVPEVLAPGPGPYDEADVQRDARLNNMAFVRLLRQQNQWSAGGKLTNVIEGLPVGSFDEVTLHDAWGGLIIFMPAQHPAIGMAPADKPFFCSPGPDRKFLTRDDNLYSYEEDLSADTRP